MSSHDRLLINSVLSAVVGLTKASVTETVDKTCDTAASL